MLPGNILVPKGNTMITSIVLVTNIYSLEKEFGPKVSREAQKNSWVLKHLV